MPGTRKLGKPTDQRMAMLRQQVTDFLDKGRMETTVTRAKEIAPLAEKMITLGKAADLASYRQMIIPKRGFNNIFAKPLEALNVDVLNKFEDGAVVDAQALLDAGILSKCRYGVKFLGNGELTKNLTVKAAAFSETAKQKIEAAGGKAEVV